MDILQKRVKAIATRFIVQEHGRHCNGRYVSPDLRKSKDGLLQSDFIIFVRLHARPPDEDSAENLGEEAPLSRFIMFRIHRRNIIDTRGIARTRAVLFWCVIVRIHRNMHNIVILEILESVAPICRRDADIMQLVTEVKTGGQNDLTRRNPL